MNKRPGTEEKRKHRLVYGMGEEWTEQKKMCVIDTLWHTSRILSCSPNRAGLVQVGTCSERVCELF